MVYKYIDYTSYFDTPDSKSWTTLGVCPSQHNLPEKSHKDVKEKEKNRFRIHIRALGIRTQHYLLLHNFFLSQKSPFPPRQIHFLPTQSSSFKQIQTIVIQVQKPIHFLHPFLKSR